MVHNQLVSDHVKRVPWLLIFGLFALLAALIGVMQGPVHVSAQDVLRALLHPHSDRTNTIIVTAIREPRVLCAGLVGAALSVSGAIVQAVFKNPMADPGIIGVSAGGAMGAVIALALSLAVLQPLWLPAAAFLGAGVAVVIVYTLATKSGRTSLIGVLLAGMVVSSMLDAGVSLILSFSNNDQMRSIVFWLMGSFNGDGWTQVRIVIVPVVFGIAVAFTLTRELDLLQLGEENAHSSGVRVEFTKRLMLALVALMTGASVAVSGTIAFVGLIVPHMVRSLVGPSHRLVLPGSALLGAGLLIVADTVGRSLISNFEINVGIITSFLGGPFFLYLLMRTKLM